jgi:uncharacterized protein
MKLDNEFTVGVPIEQAWAVLTDLELIAPCMPGALLTGVNDGVYTGKVKVKVGPVTAEYAGTARFTEKDDAAYRAVIDARGRDSRGQGNANAVIAAQLRADGSATLVTVDTDLSIAGRIAQFGSGMIKEVSAKLLGQFVECLEQKLSSGAPASSADGAGTPGAGSGAAPGAGSGAAPGAEGGAARGAERGAAAPGSEGEPALAGSSAAAATSEAVATGAVARTAAPPRGGLASPASGEPPPLDLMSLAARSVVKRVVPVVIAVIVIVVVIVVVATR